MREPPSQLSIRRELLSIVVPCYNEEAVILQTVSRLLALFPATRLDLRTEFVFVDDGSSDATRRLLQQQAALDGRIRLVGLARNFGHQLAITAGIDAAAGDALVLMDADLQDPPELVEQMVAKWREGFDVVYGRRLQRDGETRFKRLSAHVFYRLLSRVSEVHVPPDAGDFRLISRRVADAVRAMPESHRFIRGMVSWAGFRQTAIGYRRAPRSAGSSKYPFWRMASLAADGLMAFSTRPLKLATAMGLLSAALALAGIVYALALRLFTQVWVEGWTTLIIAVLFIGGVQLICLGIIGEYIGRMYIESKRRPLYLVDERIGFGAEPVGAAPAAAPGAPAASAREAATVPS